MDTDTHGPKSVLRSQIRERLSRISTAVRAVESIDVCERLKTQMASAHTILFFAPLADELDIWPVLEISMALGTTCALPFYDRATKIYGVRRLEKLATDIVTGNFGIREPAVHCEIMSLTQFDLVLVPGVAFDRQGGRLGRGFGFYDRILAEASGVKCGVAYDFQLLDQIPTEPHDAKVDFILTPNGCVRRPR